MDLVQLRQTLHSHPSLSGNEEETAQRIESFLSHDEGVKFIRGIGGFGLAAIYTFKKSGPTVLFRCELDALPINESKSLNYASMVPGVSHKCGHDGHMAIVAGLGKWLSRQYELTGKVILLFQPAEETGKGAKAVLEDETFANLQPDYCFALHNIPGEPLHEIIVPKETFSATVQSAKISLKGIGSHASEPLKGRSPLDAIIALRQAFKAIQNPEEKSTNFSLITPVYITCGKPDYGMAPGIGEFHLTCRTWSTKEMKSLVKAIEDIVLSICSENKLKCEINWFDYFPSAINDPRCLDIVYKAAKNCGLIIQERKTPFRFGEDFGHFAQKYSSVMFGIGAGLKTPNLHNSEYDFPDVLIKTGVQLYKSIVQETLR